MGNDNTEVLDFGLIAMNDIYAIKKTCLSIANKFQQSNAKQCTQSLFGSIVDNTNPNDIHSISIGYESTRHDPAIERNYNHPSKLETKSGHRTDPNTNERKKRKNIQHIIEWLLIEWEMTTMMTMMMTMMKMMKIMMAKEHDDDNNNGGGK